MTMMPVEPFPLSMASSQRRGGVVLTTVTDVVGFLSFLGLGALLLV